MNTILFLVRIENVQEYMVLQLTLTAYKELLAPYYRFVTVESRGVNAFYIRNDIDDFTMPSKTFEWRRISNMYGAGKRYKAFQDSINTPGLENGGWIDL